MEEDIYLYRMIYSIDEEYRLKQIIFIKSGSHMSLTNIYILLFYLFLNFILFY